MPKVNVNGKNVILNKKDFLSQGGEGSVYIKNQKAFKIYNDCKNMISAGKINELSVLNKNNIIKPEEVVFSGKNAVGYTMKYIPNTFSLCQMFTKAFKDRNKISNDIILELVKRMRETVEFIHKNNVLIVDLNEMNFLVSKKFDDVYFIDVDSYQTPSYPATALMESVKDRHAKPNCFNENTDWFSFAIVSFQLFIGIHPYKGKHPKFNGFDQRMINNISVFNKDVRVPKCCSSFDVVPQNWKEWYLAVFDKGKRCSPPLEGRMVPDLQVIISVIEGSDNFIFQEMINCNSQIISYESNYGHECLICVDGLFFKHKHIKYEVPCVIGYYGATPFAAKIKNGLVNLFNVKMQKDVKINDIYADNIMSIDGRIYIKQNDKILELNFLGNEFKPIVAGKIVGNVMEHATQMFQGVAIQNIVGNYFVSIFPDTEMCLQFKLNDLQGYKIFSAKYQAGVLMVIAAKKGKYDRFVYTLKDGKLESPRIEKDIQSYELNFTVLGNCLCVCINDQENVEIFNRLKPNKIKIVKDNVMHGGMKLFCNGDNVVVVDDKRILSVKMK